MHLLEYAGRCVVEVDSGSGSGSGAERVELSLRPPCHLLRWVRPPPRQAGPDGASDGVAVGDTGQPMAWRYPSAGGATVIAILGDPIPDDLRSDEVLQKRLASGYHCAGRVQGVLFGGAKPRAGNVRGEGSILCLEDGMEERTFWLLSHE